MGRHIQSQDTVHQLSTVVLRLSALSTHKMYKIGVFPPLVCLKRVRAGDLSGCMKRKEQHLYFTFKIFNSFTFYFYIEVTQHRIFKTIFNFFFPHKQSYKLQYMFM